MLSKLFGSWFGRSNSALLSEETPEGSANGENEDMMENDEQPTSAAIRSKSWLW